jgi:opacity protein-like surface antigen
MNTKITRQLSMGLMVAGLAAASTGLANNWYVGAGVGYTKASASTGVGAVNSTPSSASDRKNLTSSSMVGGIVAGHTFHCNSFNWFIQGRGLWDNAELKADFDLAAAFGKNSIKINRSGTLAFDVGVTKPFHEIDFSLKLGVLLSKFDIKYSDPARSFTAKKNSYAWGIAPGVSVEKNLGFMTIGLNYEYQIYQVLKHSFANVTSRISYDVRPKPRYHSFMVTIKKAF